MKSFKFMLVAFAITLSTASFANPVKEEGAKKEPVSTEIQKMLSDSNLIIEKEIMVTIIFKVTGDKRIDVHLVKSENEEVNEFLQKRLQNQKLHGDNWFTEKVYELPVKVQTLK